MLRRLARALVLKYPQPWRDRYGDEVLELLDDSPVRFSDLGELVRGLIVERARALIEDADHPHRTAAILGWTLPMCVVLFMLFAWGAGAALRTWQALPQPPAFDSWINACWNVFYQGFAAGILSAAFWPRRRLLQTLVRIKAVEAALASARTWVDGCRTMIAKGVPSPLDEAQANVDRLSKEREDVMAQLQGLGYRVRFR